MTTPGSEFKSKPLLTFALIAYKQERFIREAIEGAFSQTYSPLEIILSDDCSPDRTFEIMRDAAAMEKLCRFVGKPFEGQKMPFLNRTDLRKDLHAA